MSKYNRFAKELDAAFREARDEFAAAYERYQAAENSPKRQSKDYATYTRATAEWLATRDEFKRTQEQIWDNFNRKRASLRNELEKEVRNDVSADPDKMDENGLELMRSGILNVDDFHSLADRYMEEDNLTMVRLLSKYARETADEMGDRGQSSQRGALYHLANSCSQYKNRWLQAWDSLSTTADYCGGRCIERRNPPGHTVAMGKRWEQLAGEAIANF